MGKRPYRVVELIANTATLTKKDRLHLREHRLLNEETIDGHFLSGDPESLAPAFKALEEKGLVDEAIAAGLVVKVNGSLNWNDALVSDRILIVYLDIKGRPFQLRAHKMQMKGAPLEIYGLSFLAKVEGPVVIVEGEFKALLLNQLGIPAIAVPGVSSFVGKKFDELIGTLKEAGIEEVVVLFDNDDRVSPLLGKGGPNPYYKSEAEKRYDVERYAFQLARRLRYDGIQPRIAHIPDEWRVDGGADVDSIMRSGRSSEDIVKLVAAALPPEEYLSSQTEECSTVVTKKLGDGTVKTNASGFRINSFPLELRFKVTKGRQKGGIALLVNGRSVHVDLINVLSKPARHRFLEDAAGHLEEDEVKLLGDMVQDLAKAVGSRGGGSGSEEPGALDVLGAQVIVHPSGYQLQTAEGCKPISNFVAVILTEDIIDDGLEEERWFTGEVVQDGETYPFSMRAKDFGSQRCFDILMEQVGSSLLVDNPSLVRRTIQASSSPVETRVLKQFGWDQKGRYLTPSGQICPVGVDPLSNVRIDLSLCERASMLDLPVMSPEEVVGAARLLFNDVIQVGDTDATPILVGLSLAPVVGGYAVSDFLYGMHIAGISGSLKTTVARALQCLYGPGYSEDVPLLSWTSTPNYLQKMGYFFGGALAVIDDFRLSFSSNHGGLQMLIQNIFDRQSRGRLRADATFRKSYPFRGYPLSTGEDGIGTSASNIARILPVPWSGSAADKTPPERVKRVRDGQKDLAGFTRELVRFVQGKPRTEIREQYEEMVSWIGKKFETKIANRHRVTNILALNRLSFTLGVLCANSIGALDDMEMLSLQDDYQAAEDLMVAHLQGVLAEKEPARLFLECLAAIISSNPELLAGGSADDGRGKKILHAKRIDGVLRLYAVPDAAYHAVARHYRAIGEQFPFSKEAVGADLNAKGYLIREDRKHLTAQVRLGQTKVRAWRLDPESLGVYSDAFVNSLRAVLGKADDP